jgi:hypothetical protein
MLDPGVVLRADAPDDQMVALGDQRRTRRKSRDTRSVSRLQSVHNAAPNGSTMPDPARGRLSTYVCHSWMDPGRQARQRRFEAVPRTDLEELSTSSRKMKSASVVARMRRVSG